MFWIPHPRNHIIRMHWIWIRSNIKSSSALQAPQISFVRPYLIVFNFIQLKRDRVTSAAIKIRIRRVMYGGWGNNHRHLDYYCYSHTPRRGFIALSTCSIMKLESYVLQVVINFLLLSFFRKLWYEVPIKEFPQTWFWRPSFTLVLLSFSV